jgi:hypothetical protein
MTLESANKTATANFWNSVQAAINEKAEGCWCEEVSYFMVSEVSIFMSQTFFLVIHKKSVTGHWTWPSVETVTPEIFKHIWTKREFCVYHVTLWDECAVLHQHILYVMWFSSVYTKSNFQLQTLIKVGLRKTTNKMVWNSMWNLRTDLMGLKPWKEDYFNFFHSCVMVTNTKNIFWPL